MSNAARKARKAAGIQFVHPVKVATPFFDRAAFKEQSAKHQDEIAKHQDEIAKDWGHDLTPAIREVLGKLRPPRPRPVRNYSK